MGGDFSLPYAASEAALSGQAERIYDAGFLLSIERKYAGKSLEALNWHYPPPTLLSVLPLAWMDFTTARYVWIAFGILVFLWAIAKTITPNPGLLAVALFFPLVANNMVSSQNALLVAALAFGGLCLLERRPILAGVFIGLLTIKPQLGILIPILLIAGGYWKSFAAAVVTTLVLALASLAMFGIDTWFAFFHDMTSGASLAEVELKDGWSKMLTPYAGARQLGVPHGAAMLFQGVVSLTLAVACFFWWRRGDADFNWKVSMTLIASPLAVPYAQFYDIALIAAPFLLSILALPRLQNRRWVELGLAFTYLMPILLFHGSHFFAIPGQQLGLLALLVLYWRGYLLPRQDTG